VTEIGIGATEIVMKLYYKAHGRLVLNGERFEVSVHWFHELQGHAITLTDRGIFVAVSVTHPVVWRECPNALWMVGSVS
jgi:hypothetical protein